MFNSTFLTKDGKPGNANECAVSSLANAHGSPAYTAKLVLPPYL